MTVYIMGKPVPDADLADRLDESATHARRLRAVSRDRISTVEAIRARDYRRVMDMAEDLLLVAHAQAKVGNHPDAEVVSRWLLHVAETCKARLVDSGRYHALARDVGSGSRKRYQ